MEEYCLVAFSSRLAQAAVFYATQENSASVTTAPCEIASSTSIINQGNVPQASLSSVERGHFLKLNSLFSNDPRLCQVDIKNYLAEDYTAKYNSRCLKYNMKSIVKKALSCQLPEIC